MHTETQKVTYYNGHVVEINGKRYAPKHTCTVQPSFAKPVKLEYEMQEWLCWECHEFSFTLEGEPPKYCSNCGAEVRRIND